MPSLPETWDSKHWDLEFWDAVANHHQPYISMPNDNRISAEVAPADKTAILTKITEINTLLPFLINLTKDERIDAPEAE
jgi:hypothetical protein